MTDRRDDRPPRSALRVEPAGDLGPTARAGGSKRRELSVEDYVQGVRAGDRTVLGRALTLVESQRYDHQELAQQVLAELLPHTGGSIRVGISGVPGAGKSTFIEVLGGKLTAAGHKLAVLAVDPSSEVSGGSILGDKTRMTRLGADPRAFVRPSPNAGTLGGVAAKTRECLLVCEAAGYDVVFVETVGVGQSETAVAQMTDVFLALLLAGAGDELQGIKRGLLELVDVVAINKADGDRAGPAEKAAQQLRSALHVFRGGDQVPVLTCSALSNTGVDEVWTSLTDLHAARKGDGELARRRREQAVGWMWSLVEELIHGRLRTDPKMVAVTGPLTQAVRDAELPPAAAARAILAELLRADRQD